MKFWLFKFRSTAKNGKALFLNKENAIFFKLWILFQIVAGLLLQKFVISTPKKHVLIAQGEIPLEINDWENCQKEF